MSKPGKAVRLWIKWTVAAVWLLTAIAVFILSLVHAPTTATVTLHVREIHFRTDPWTMLDAADQIQFTISGPARLRIAIAPAASSARDLNLDAKTGAASCSFYSVRTGPLRLVKDTDLTILWPNNADADSFAIRVLEPVSGNIVARHQSEDRAAFACTGVSDTKANSDVIQGNLSDSFDSSFSTTGRAQLTFHEASTGSLGGNVRVTGTIRVGHIDPTESGEETAALLDPLAGQANEIVFDRFSRPLTVNTGDILDIVPGKDFYLRRIQVSHGIELEFHGTVKEVHVGAGAENNENWMPSLFDLLDTKKRLFAVVPSIAAFIFGLLESLGMLPKKTPT